MLITMSKLRCGLKTDNTLLYSSPVKLHIGGVTQMVGWLNLRNAAGAERVQEALVGGTRHYYGNVQNAFQTAPALSNAMQADNEYVEHRQRMSPQDAANLTGGDIPAWLTGCKRYNNMIHFLL